MSFHEVCLPMRLALGATGGPRWRTDVATLASGHEIRNALWSRSRRQWQIGSPLTDLAQLQILIGFFEARSGRLHGFRFRDPMDHASAPAGATIGFEDQIIGQGDGAQTIFQLIKTQNGAVRQIHKPVSGTVMIGINGAQAVSGWTLDATTGQISFAAPPAAASRITAGYEFDCPVRFDADEMSAVVEAFGAGRVAAIGLLELLVVPT